MALQDFLDESRRLVDATLDRWLPAADAEPRRLNEAARYALFAGGKRLRPAVARAACRALGGSDEDVLPACCALELVHTYSLIHDDLPAVDDDDLRRGQPTCHVRFGEATAILAGDALQTEAFRILAEHTPRPELVADLVTELARAAGIEGMVGGEVADLEAEGQTPDRDRVEFIHNRKTAALFGAAATMGGIVAGASQQAREALRRYGRSMGLAFQIVDDVLDETGDAATLGKSPGKDRRARKMTYPAVAGIDASRQAARELAARAAEALAVLEPGGGIEELTGIAEYVVSRAQ
ncbi:MAG: polyprenyl synthetase family protein [Planctomycetota bacterium]|nr:polyprenyl synthetase family protein [Planctomycetota bacterium]